MGARLGIDNVREESNEPVADLHIESSPLRGIRIGGAQIPRLIDELPIIAVAATQAEGTTVICDAGELRLKETDRIRAMVSELTKMGARIEEKPDGIAVEGPTELRGDRCSSFADHRIAMSLAIAGLVARGKTVIADAESIDVSFPGFMSILGTLLESERVAEY
jgi:3-phosphoshikimate 1-carboxyvinyltransferase